MNHSGQWMNGWGGSGGDAEFVWMVIGVLVVVLLVILIAKQINKK